MPIVAKCAKQSNVEKIKMLFSEYRDYLIESDLEDALEVAFKQNDYEISTYLLSKEVSCQTLRSFKDINDDWQRQAGENPQERVL